MSGPELKNFRDSPWRYSQFVVLGLIAAGLLKWLSPLAWLPSLGIGALLALAYLGFEKKRGVI